MKTTHTENSSKWKQHKRLPFALVTAKRCPYIMEGEVRYNVVTIKVLGIPIYRFVDTLNNF